MSAARAHILSTIRTSLGRTSLEGERRAALEQRLKDPVSNVVPSRGQIVGDDGVEQFIDEARLVDATTEQLDQMADIPQAVIRYLTDSNVSKTPQKMKIAPQPTLEDLSWPENSVLNVSVGPASPDDDVSLALAHAGIAETGTLVMVSSQTCPISIHFLAEIHIVVMRARDIVGAYEDVWYLLRSQNKQGFAMPRSVNLITGPSRTADIEQTLLLGAHGPKFLHILVIGDG